MLLLLIKALLDRNNNYRVVQKKKKFYTIDSFVVNSNFCEPSCTTFCVVLF